MKKRIIVLLVTVFTLLISSICLAGCGACNMLDITPKNFAYDGVYITWDKNELCSYYEISINDAESSKTYANSFEYRSDGEFTAKVTAYYAEGEDYSKTASVTFKPLASVTDLTVSQKGVLTWSPVEQATSYQINVNGSIAVSATNSYDKLNAGNNQVKVRPVGKNTTSVVYYSVWSEQKEVGIYEKPSNINYEDGAITWTGNASTYMLVIKGEAHEVTGNRYDYDSQGKSFDVNIYAKGNYETTYDSKDATEQFIYLDPITNLYIEDGIVKWDVIPGAKGYKVKINGIPANSVEKNQFEFLPTGISSDVCVMPYNDTGKYFSQWSSEKSVYILETPTVKWDNSLELDGEANNNFSWNPVNLANSYQIRLTKDGNFIDEFPISSLQNSFPYAYIDVATYKVEVKAVAPAESDVYYDSRYSNAIVVERLSAPSAVSTNYIVSDKDSLAKGFTVTFNKVKNATSYQLYKEGVALDGKSTTTNQFVVQNVTDSPLISEQAFNYYIRSMGEVKTVNNTKMVTLPCLKANALSFKITVQATPQNVNMNGFFLGWDAVSGANGYTVMAGTKLTPSQNTVSLEGINEGQYQIQVCARGNGSDVLPSSFTPELTVQRIGCPTELKVSSESNGTLKYKSVQYAQSYSIYRDGSKDALDENAFDNMYQYITCAGTTISMVANANYYNPESEIYYMSSKPSSSQQFIRLAQPTFSDGAVANSVELVWNAPNNINVNEYTPTYKVYSSIGSQIGGGSLNSTKFSITYLEGGASYNFYVKAIGNDTKYVDSDYSLVKTVYKLSTPTIDIQDNQYVWSGITNASSYYLSINGIKANENFHVSGAEYSFKPTFTVVGTHDVLIKALGDGKDTINSDSSTFTQTVAKLERPVITSAQYSSSSFVPEGNISVSINGVANASQYLYEIAGETIYEEQTECSKVITNTGKYVVRAKAIGGCFDSNDVYYIDSEFVGGGEAYTFTLLGTPDQAKFEMTTDGVIKWGAVSESFGYEYMLAFDGGEFAVTPSFINSNQLEAIADYKTYSSISIKIRAKGDTTGKTVSSAWVEWTWSNSGV